MADKELWQAPDIVPSITYVNLDAAIEWLVRVFGFRERTHARLTWPGGGMTWMEVGNSLFNCTTFDDTWGQDAAGPLRRFKMKIYVPDIEQHYARAVSEGAKIIAPPTDGFWGGRIYRALDLEDNHWEISQAGRDLAAELWQLPPGVKRGVSN